MAEHLIRRWFQFAVLDLLTLTAVAAVVVALCRPAPARTCAGRPWICGAWVSDFDEQLVLLPDGAYAYYPRGWPIHSTELSVAGGWKVITPRGQPGEAFCLRCGEQLFVIRLVESGDRTMEVLNRDGSIGSKLRQLWQLRGTTCNGRPHGTWTSIFKDGPPSWREYRKSQVVDRHTSVSLEYRNGELVDWYDHAREAHDLARVNRLRRANGLAELSVRDFLNATRVDPESHD